MSCAIHQPSALPKPSVVSVNGVVVARAAIAREAQHHPAPKPILAWQAAARALVLRELLLQEARRVAVAAEPAVDAQGRRETEDEALIRTLAEREVAVPEADEASCRRYYEQNRRRFRSADIYEAAHILFAAHANDRAAFGQAQQDAAAALAELGQHPERFADLARAHSACPSGAQGGNLGQITAGQTTPEFEQALRALAPGALSAAPVVTRYGVHIIRLDRKIEGRPLPFEFVHERIAAYLTERTRRTATALYIARLVSRAQITGIELAGAEAHQVH
jgi:peptidyl-prolyl cis-trans isomerase C